MEGSEPPPKNADKKYHYLLIKKVRFRVENLIYSAKDMGNRVPGTPELNHLEVVYGRT